MSTTPDIQKEGKQLTTLNLKSNLQGHEKAIFIFLNNQKFCLQKIILIPKTKMR